MLKEDYREFDAVFNLEALRSGFIGSFFTYFDVEFNECLKPLKFSMEPDNFGKAWCQLIFFLNFHKEFHVKEFEEIYGTFRMSALSGDFEKIDWKIFVIHSGERVGFRETWTYHTR